MKTKKSVLSDDMKFPPIGPGTYRLNGREGVKATQRTVEIGYHLLNSAFSYENESVVGGTARTSCVPGSKLIITSKLPGRHQKYGEALLTVKESLCRGGLDYYDIYLVHWPNPKTGLYMGAWQAVIEAKRRGMIRSIGVYNFLPGRLERLTKETEVTPGISQVELHPYFSQEEQRRWDAARGIVDES